MKPSEFLRSKKWIKGSSTSIDEQGKIDGCCTVGAISCSTLMFEGATKREQYMKEFRKLIPSHMTIPIWNDCYALDKEEVIAKLEEVEKIMGL